MKQYGCIGKKLTHSFSKEIHAKLADYDYELIELTEEEIAPFFEKRAFAAINVTIPYKQTVIPDLDSISPVAQRIGAVNTIVNKDGKLYGSRSSAAKPSAKSSEYRIWALGGNSSSPSQTRICI